MRLVNQFASLSIVLAATACGVKKDEKNDAATVVAETPAAAPAQPASTIVRVPVDANGAPTGEPEMRLIADAKDLNSNEAVEAAFNEGKAPEKLVQAESELDGDTSTQAWGCWTRSYYTPSNSYSSYGYSNSYGYTNYNSYNTYNSYGSNYWASSYRPTLYSGGSSYGYNYGGSYGYGYGAYNGGYSYYTYNRGY